MVQYIVYDNWYTASVLMHKCFVAIVMKSSKIGYFVGVHYNVYFLTESNFYVLQHYFYEVKSFDLDFGIFLN